METVDTRKEYTVISRDNRRLLYFRRATVAPFKRETRRHHHADFEIAYFASGSGIYTVGKQTFDIRPGDVFLFSTDEVHCITEIFGDDGMNYSVMHFSPSFIWSTGGIGAVGLLKIFFNRSENFCNRLDRQNPTTAIIRKLMDEIEDEFIGCRAEHELMIQTKLLNILVLLTRDYGYIDESIPDTGFANVNSGSIEKALGFIDNNLSEPLTLEGIASYAGMNKTYFSTLFKKLNGLSPWDYITVRRIEKAVSLLKSTDRSVLDIALMCGYNNTANFNRAFRKITGKSPKEIRTS